MLLRVKEPEPEQAQVSLRPSWLPFDVPLMKAERVSARQGGTPEERKNVMASVRSRLPQTDDTRDAIVSAAQRAVERARDAVNTAFEQMPEVSLPSLPDTIANVQVPRRKKKRSGPPIFVIIGAVVALAAGGFFLYRWIVGPSDDDFGIDEDWPEEPNFGNTKQAPEDDRQASLDAEHSLEARGAVPPAGVAPDVNGSR